MREHERKLSYSYYLLHKKRGYLREKFAQRKMHY